MKHQIISAATGSTFRTRVYQLIAALLLAASSLLLLAARPVAAATMTVINTNDSGAGSLRQAILDANGTVGADTINFSIGSGAQHIIPASALPPITQPLNIDGTSQPGFTGAPLIELSGDGAGAGARGLYITGAATTSTVRGLIINHFSAQGIFIDTSSVVIAGNYIGTAASGMSAAGTGNGGDGIGIFSGTSAASANGNTIGGVNPADRNVISGNALNGIGMTAQVGGSTSSNHIVGNLIGTNAAGTAALANGGDGVLINHADGGGPATAAGNVIGGDAGANCSAACNLIS